MITILVVDDQPSIRRGLQMRLALEPDLQVIGEAEDGAAAIALASELHPDVVLMDVVMPETDGIAATTTLRSTGNRPGVVILSLYDDAETRAQAELCGADAFVAKHEPDAALIAAIRQAAARS